MSGVLQSEIDGKSDLGHIHDDRYYTETEVDNLLLATVSGVGSGHTIQDEGIDLTKRTNLNFKGSGVIASDNAGNDATDITISGNVDGGSASSVYLETQVIDGGGA